MKNQGKCLATISKWSILITKKWKHNVEFMKGISSYGGPYVELFVNSEDRRIGQSQRRRRENVNSQPHFNLSSLDDK